MNAQQMIRTHPHVRGNTNDTLIPCIGACYACAQTCTICADACLGGEMVQQLTQCIRLNLDCADICGAGGVMPRAYRLKRGRHPGDASRVRRGLPALRGRMRAACRHA